MGMITTPSTMTALARAAGSSRQPSGYRFVGIAIATIVPAAIWTVLIELVAMGLGSPLSAMTMLIIASSIAVFLFAVCAPLMLRKPLETAEVRAFARATRR